MEARLETQSSQPQASWGDIPSIDTPRTMVDMVSPLTATHNPAEGVATDQSFSENHSPLATDAARTYSSSSSPR